MLTSGHKLTLLMGYWSLVIAGCAGGTGGGITPIGGNNQNSGTTTNTNNNSGMSPTNGNTSPNPDPEELSVVISGLPATDLMVGDELSISAEVSGAQGVLLYQWTIDQSSDIAILDDDASADVSIIMLAPGDFTLGVSVMDDVAEASTQVQLLVAGDEPPVEAMLEVLAETLIASPGELVALIATTAGPTPQSIAWSADPTNPIQPFDFVDQGNGTATFTVPTLLDFPYTLRFTVTATYEQGSLTANTDVFVN